MQLRTACGVLLVLALGLHAGERHALAQGPSTVPAAPMTTSGPTLAPGDPAPPLSIGTWVKGQPVPVLKKGNTYVIEFWATWCGPCRQTIPHLTELQKKYKDKNVTIIGISSGERKGLSDVTPFVETMGDKMGYTVAYDKDRDTFTAWMAAAGQNGIPTAFVVNSQGQIAWIGHPMNGLDPVVEEVASHRYDIKAAIARAEKIKVVTQKLGVAAQAGDTSGVLAGLDELMVLDTPRVDEYAIKKLNILLFMIKDYTAGYELAGKLIDQNFKDNADVLNSIAWAILDDPSVEKRDLQIAMRASLRANELTAGKNPLILNSLARAHFETGDPAKAIELQTLAVNLSQNEEQKKDLQSRLDKYQEPAKN